MTENSVYKNDKITKWYHYTRSRYNSLLGMYNDKSIPDDVIELMGKRLLKGTAMLRAEGADVLATEIEQKYVTMICRRKNIWPVYDETEHARDAQSKKYAKIVLLVLLASVLLPKLAVSQPFLNSIVNAHTLSYLQKLRGFGALSGIGA